jgi:hypothetical protein
VPDFIGNLIESRLDRPAVKQLIERARTWHSDRLNIFGTLLLSLTDDTQCIRWCSGPVVGMWIEFLTDRPRLWLTEDVLDNEPVDNVYEIVAVPIFYDRPTCFAVRLSTRNQQLFHIWENNEWKTNEWELLDETPLTIELVNSYIISIKSPTVRSTTTTAFNPCFLTNRIPWLHLFPETIENTKQAVELARNPSPTLQTLSAFIIHDLATLVLTFLTFRIFRP